MASTNRPVYLVILAGGVGSRFWPFSCTQQPKQFHDVLGLGRSMLQLKFDRFRDLCPPENVLVVTNRDYVALVRERLPELPADIGWSDLSIWDSLRRLSTHDAQHNAVDGQVLLYDAQECLAKTPPGRLVVQGLDHYLVAEHDNVLLICQRSAEQRVRDFVRDARARLGNGYH